ncbi:MAG TPA: hypothetical protein VI755_02080 [Anaerolineales bacterium]|nr:hypothetical protein [Anaerolineales bacterium]
MTAKLCAMLFLLGLGISLVVAGYQSAPGYMDADYYFADGLRLAQGFGFSEPFLWNYLDNPQGIPHPMFTYWMPYAALLAAVGMKVSGMMNFAGARLGFLLIAGCLPPLTATLAHTFTPQRWAAILAGLLAALPGFYLAFVSTTDTFGLYMLFGGLFFLILNTGGNVEMFKGFNVRTFFGVPLLLGLLAGSMHLARADGLLWLGIGVIAVSGQRVAVSGWPPSITQRASHKTFLRSRYTFHASRLIFLILGYLIVMSPWLVRNLTTFGTLLAPGGGRALWITAYDEIFAYPAAILTPMHWWAAGLGEIIRARLGTLSQNLQTAFAVQGGILLAPLIVAGMWRMRHDRRVRLGGLAWGMLFLGMTLVFPYPGARGGFFHAGAALQPLFWGLVPAGLDSLLAWGDRQRGWNPHVARPILGAGLVGLTLLLTGLTTWSRVTGQNQRIPAWGEAEAAYLHLEQTLHSLGANPEDIVVINNPPGYQATTGRTAIVIPDGDEKTSLAVAQRYRGKYLLLEQNHPAGLDDLYRDPRDRPGLRYLKTDEGIHIFEVISND